MDRELTLKLAAIQRAKSHLAAQENYVREHRKAVKSIREQGKRKVAPVNIK